MGVKNVCDKTFSKHLIENFSKIFLNDGYGNHLLSRVCKHFFLTFIIKRLINGIHKTFYKWFLYPSFLTFAKCFHSNIYKTQTCLLGYYFMFKYLLFI